MPEAGKDTNQNCQYKLIGLLAAGLVLTNNTEQGMEKHTIQTEAKLIDHLYDKKEPQEQCSFQNKNIKKFLFTCCKTEK